MHFVTDLNSYSRGIQFGFWFGVYNRTEQICVCACLWGGGGHRKAQMMRTCVTFAPLNRSSQTCHHSLNSEIHLEMHLVKKLTVMRWRSFHNLIISDMQVFHCEILPRTNGAKLAGAPVGHKSNHSSWPMEAGGENAL